MSSFPDISSASAKQTGFQDTGFSGRAEQKDLSASHRLDAGLTIKTREGDVVTLSSSRFSSLNAREYNSSYTAGSMSGRTNERQIQLASGETFTFSVQGNLNEQELADIQDIVSGVDGIIYEMAQGNMDGAVANALSMKSYDSVSMYEADITVARSYAVSAQTEAVSSGAKLPGGYGNQNLPGMDALLPAAFSSPFMDQVSQLLKDQDAQTLAYARQPLSQLFSHYLDQQEGPQQTGGSNPSSLTSSESSPLTLALESTAKMVDQLIQNMVKEAFDHTLDQIV